MQKYVDRLWKLASKFAHLLGAIGNLAVMSVAILSATNIVGHNTRFLAILIAWSNLCGAIHRTHSHFQTPEDDR